MSRNIDGGRLKIVAGGFILGIIAESRAQKCKGRLGGKLPTLAEMPLDEINKVRFVVPVRIFFVLSNRYMTYKVRNLRLIVVLHQTILVFLAC